MMKVVLKTLILSLALAGPTAVSSKCITCPGGIETDPTADASGGDGLYTCETVDNFYESLDDLECLSVQFGIAEVCCPSLLLELGKDNSCGWCPNGLINPQAQFQITGESDPLSCAGLMNLAATGYDDFPEVCNILKPATDLCCPGDSSGYDAYICEFCAAGVEFPEKIIPLADNATCEQIAQFSGFFNQTLCESTVLALSSECCPNSFTDPPADNSECQFCPLGLEFPSDTIPGTNFTCEDMKFGALFAQGDDCSGLKNLEGFCCPSTTDGFQCDWCSGELGIEKPDLEFPGADLTCAQIGGLVPGAATEDLCNQFKLAEGLCCPTTVGAIPCDFCNGPGGLEFPDRVVDEEDEVTCSDLAALALTPPGPDYCINIEPAQGRCCPASTGVSLPPVAEGEYCYICGNAETEMTTPDAQPFNFLGRSEDLDDLKTCAEIEEEINLERGEGESCVNALSELTARFSPSVCGCAGVEPPNPCKFCEGRSIKRDVKIPTESFTCGQGYDFIKHFAAGGIQCNAPNTALSDVEKTCCGDPVESPTKTPPAGGKVDSAASIARGFFVGFVSLAVVMLA